MLDSLIHSFVDHLATLHLECQKKMSLKAIEDLNAILRSQCRYFPDGPDGYYSSCPPLPWSDIVINHCGSDRNLCIQAARPCFFYATLFSRAPIRHCVLTLDFGHQPHTCALRSIRGYVRFLHWLGWLETLRGYRCAWVWSFESFDSFESADSQLSLASGSEPMLEICFKPSQKRWVWLGMTFVLNPPATLYVHKMKRLVEELGGNNMPWHTLRYTRWDLCSSLK